MPDNASAAPTAETPASEFTGERVIPGQVDVNLWNEHKARYAFAARLARYKRVLDVGCGSGYGSFDLARAASAVTGIDFAPEALEYAVNHYRSRNLMWAQGSASSLPFRDGSFDLVVAFEVIEHLSDWHSMLTEARRLLTTGGQFIVSTPNKLYYGESRRETGPNPFHVHEFEFAEFQDVLHELFPHVSLFLENHTEGILFQAITNPRGADVRIESEKASPAAANFFIAVCALTPQTGSPAFIYLPEAGNVLRERELHIRRLESELQTKNEWLDQSRAEHAELVKLFREQTAELEARNKWAQELSETIAATRQRIADLQAELDGQTAGYEAKIADLEEENRKKTHWAMDTEARLTGELAAKVSELAEAVDYLHKAEATVEERSKWALDLQAQNDDLLRRLAVVESSRWMKLGKVIGVGPRLQDR